MGETANLTSLEIAEALLADAPQEFANSLFFIATLTILIYDTLLTMEEEWTYLWKSKWSPIKCIFLTVRYITLALQITQAIALYGSGIASELACSVFKWFEGVGGIAMQSAADMFLIYRVYAFCGRNKYLLVCLSILYIGSQATLFSLVGIFLPQYIEIANPASQFRFLLGECVPLVFPRRITAVWIITLSFQSILFGCLLFQIAYAQFGAWYLGIRPSPLYIIFIRDGIWAYFLIVVSLLLCIVSAYKAQTLSGSFISWLFTITAVCCCRLILNLRSAAHEPASDESAISLTFKVNDNNWHTSAERTGDAVV